MTLTLWSLTLEFETFGGAFSDLVRFFFILHGPHTRTCNDREIFVLPRIYCDYNSKDSSRFDIWTDASTISDQFYVQTTVIPCIGIYIHLGKEKYVCLFSPNRPHFFTSTLKLFIGRFINLGNFVSLWNQIRLFSHLTHQLTRFECRNWPKIFYRRIHDIQRYEIKFSLR
jgi:hypothetical protein